MDRVTLEMKTVEEALAAALKMLGATREEVEVIVEEEPSKGFLGIGAKEAKVTVIRKGSGSEGETLEEIKDNKFDFEKEMDNFKDRAEGFAEEAKESLDDLREDLKEKYEDIKKDASELFDERVKKPFRSLLLEGVDHYETEDEMAEVARNYLEKLINLMGFESHVEIIDERDKGENLVLDIVLDDYEQNSRIIGKKGSTIDALGYMVAQFVRGRYDGRMMLEVDCGDYIYDQKERLKALARNAGERALRDGEYRLRPMNAYDRRIVHKALNDMEGVSTHSEGEEPRRSIVITRDPQ